MAALGQVEAENYSSISLSHCNDSLLSVKWNGFLSTLLPKTERLMLVYFDFSFGRRRSMLKAPKLCLGIEANTVNVMLLPCNSDDQGLQWFQYNQLLINLKAGKCMSSNKSTNGEENVIVKECDQEAEEQQLTCEVQQATQLLLSEKKLVADAKRKTVHLSSESDTRWIFITDSDEDSLSLSPLNKLCEAKSPYCALPSPGINSLIVSNESGLQNTPHLPPLLRHQFVQTTLRSCYVGGDVLLLSCDVGHVETYYENSTYKRIMCLGNNRWSDPVPLHCKKRSCGPPLGGDFSTVKESGIVYGDIAIYKCMRNYFQNDVVSVCDSNGSWTNKPPKCQHICRKTYNELEGTILSPNYPNPYPRLITCKWVIHVPVGKRVALWFRDFYIERGFQALHNCKYDALVIKQMISGSKTGEHFCGSFAPEKFFSVGNRLEIEFHTDNTKTAKGFKIDYTTWNANETSLPGEPIRNGTFPHESDTTYVYESEERTAYIMTVMFGVFVLIAFITVIVIILRHFCKHVKISPAQFCGKSANCAADILPTAAQLLHRRGIDLKIESGGGVSFTRSKRSSVCLSSSKSSEVVRKTSVSTDMKKDETQPASPSRSTPPSRSVVDLNKLSFGGDTQFTKIEPDSQDAGLKSKHDDVIVTSRKPIASVGADQAALGGDGESIGSCGDSSSGSSVAAKQSRDPVVTSSRNSDVTMLQVSGSVNEVAPESDRNHNFHCRRQLLKYFDEVYVIDPPVNCEK